MDVMFPVSQEFKFVTEFKVFNFNFSLGRVVQLETSKFQLIQLFQRWRQVVKEKVNWDHMYQ